MHGTLQLPSHLFDCRRPAKQAHAVAYSARFCASALCSSAHASLPVGTHPHTLNLLSPAAFERCVPAAVMEWCGVHSCVIWATRLSCRVWDQHQGASFTCILLTITDHGNTPAGACFCAHRRRGVCAGGSVTYVRSRTQRHDVPHRHDDQQQGEPFPAQNRVWLLAQNWFWQQLAKVHHLFRGSAACSQQGDSERER
jgi:hypothetical protein